ncbi:hypothetical protein H2248_004062 [Termitomyces sp. 'cryptogamus']|nr:hypothetical protein H2248_004062 [Termitomyces sp. 'cryptogamus']
MLLVHPVNRTWSRLTSKCGTSTSSWSSVDIRPEYGRYTVTSPASAKTRTYCYYQDGREYAWCSEPFQQFLSMASIRSFRFLSVGSDSRTTKKEELSTTYESAYW